MNIIMLSCKLKSAFWARCEKPKSNTSFAFFYFPDYTLAVYQCERCNCFLGGTFALTSNKCFYEKSRAYLASFKTNIAGSDNRTYHQYHIRFDNGYGNELIKLDKTNSLSLSDNFTDSSYNSCGTAFNYLVWLWNQFQNFCRCTYVFFPYCFRTL